jgi:hypothetical protein
MIPKQPNIPNARRAQLEEIQRAAHKAVREALLRHMLLGESVAVVGEGGGVRMLEPEDIRKALKAA